MNHTTRCYPRTMREAFGLSAREAIAIEAYKPPFHRRLFYGLARHGWAIVPAVLAVLVLSGCNSDIDAETATAASLRDALAQAQQERPELWTPERKARADVAAGLVARGEQP